MVSLLIRRRHPENRSRRKTHLPVKREIILRSRRARNDCRDHEGDGPKYCPTHRSGKQHRRLRFCRSRRRISPALFMSCVERPGGPQGCLYFMSSTGMAKGCGIRFTQRANPRGGLKKTYQRRTGLSRRQKQVHARILDWHVAILPPLLLLTTPGVPLASSLLSVHSLRRAIRGSMRAARRAGR